MNQPEIRAEAPLSLAGFTVMDEATLESTRKNLGLSMSPAEFRACRNYYKNTVHHDPEFEELFFLDGIVCAASREPQYLCLAEMKTDSDLIAEIFADLMKHRRAVASELERPASLSDLIGIMNSYLSAAGKKENPMGNVGVRFASHRELLLACDGFRLTASTGNGDRDVAVGVAADRPSANTAVKNGDYVFAILNTKNQDENFESRLAEFLCDNSVRSIAKKTIPLCEGGILQGLLRAADAMLLNTLALLDETDTLSTLTEPLIGALIVATPSSATDMLLLADEMGLHVVRAATVTAGNDIRIPTQNGITVFRTSFLRALTLPRVYSAAVSEPVLDTPKVNLDRIGTCTLNGKKHAIVKTEAFGDGPFASALYATLYAFLLCLAAGANPCDVGIACHLSIPRPSPSRMGESLSAILGLYRAQAELGLYGNTPTVEQSNEEHPQLSVAALATLPEHPVPSAAIGGGTNIFYLEPLFGENGLIDFGDLKKMLEYVKKLIIDGHALAILPTSGDLLTDLQKMSRTASVEYLYDEPIPTRIGGLLIESNISIQGTAVAQTERHAPSTEEFDGE